jgi:hypothetical protein
MSQYTRLRDTVLRWCCPMSPLERNTLPFFHLSLKSPRTEQCPDPVQPSESIARALPVDSSAATAITTDRVRRMDGASTAADATDQPRKLAFLNAGPEKEIHNPHALQRPASPYELLVGTIISASLVTGRNADLPGFVISLRPPSTRTTTSQGDISSSPRLPAHRQVRHHRRPRAGAGAGRMAAHHPARWLIDRHFAPQGAHR